MIINRIKNSYKLNLMIQLIKDFKIMIITYLPGKAGQILRYNYYKKQLKYLGMNVTFEPGVFILNPVNVSIDDNTWIDKYVILLAGKPFEGERIIYKKNNLNYNGMIGELTIGKNSHIAPYVLISAHGGVKIGNNLTLASGVKLYSFSHHYRDLSNPNSNINYKFSSRVPENEQALILSPVVLEDNCAVGLNSVVLPGVTIGENSWVGVSSVVSHDIPKDVIVSGNPAKPIKNRFLEKNQFLNPFRTFE